MRIGDLGVVLDAMPVASMVVTPDGVIRVANAAAGEVFGAPGGLPGMSVDALVPEESRGRHAGLRGEFRAAPRPRMLGSRRDIEGRRLDGRRFPAEVGLNALHTLDGECVVVTVADLSAALAEARRLEHIVETSPAVTCVFAVGPDGRARMPWASAAIERIYGLSREQLARDAEPMFARIHPGDVGPMRASIAESAASLTPWRMLFRVCAPGEPMRWLDGHSIPHREADGTVVWVGSIHDVTERVHSAEDARRARTQLESALDAARAFTFEVDLRARTATLDARAAALLARAPERVERLSFDEVAALTHPDDLPALRVMLHRASGDEARDLTFSLRLRRGDGEHLTFSVRARVERDADGASRRVVGACVDVTAEQRARDALHVKETQLQQTQKMESIGLLAGGIAHDFNNWLTVISSNSELLLESRGGAGAGSELLIEVRDAATRAATLTRQLLAFSRQQVVEPRVLDLAAVVAEHEKLLQRMLGEDIAVRAELRAARRVRVDPGLISQVLMNLAVNARDAMPRGGALTLLVADVDRAAERGEGPSPYVRLSVRDSGEGMPPEVRARIFEPFFTTKSAGRGTGLGLAVVHGIVAQSGGLIEVESAPGAGTTFHIDLPAVDAELSAVPSQRPDVEVWGREAVLLVEDEEIVRRIAARILTQQGYRVLEASDGRRALELLDAHRESVDLLVTDVVMPELDGRELVAEATRRVPGLRVLYTSGYTDDAIVRRGVFEAEVAFLPKPYTRATLLRKVREVLDG